MVGSVPLLHPEAQIVDEVLEGWRNQQLCRNLALDTIDGRVRLVERILAYTNEFPWTWTPAMAVEFFADPLSVRHRKQSTVRAEALFTYPIPAVVRVFCSSVSDPSGRDVGPDGSACRTNTTESICRFTGKLRGRIC
jgi:integrase/recombinase XerD